MTESGESELSIVIFFIQVKRDGINYSFIKTTLNWIELIEFLFLPGADDHQKQGLVPPLPLFRY